MKTYPVNEIFYSLQGEGFNAGRPAAFVRFSGCNLRCPFCDTQHAAATRMTADEILAEVLRFPSRFVVLTGGEPSLFVDSQLVAALHENGFFVSVETNGTRALPPEIDFVTCSPKFAFCPDAPVVLEKIDELKVIFDGKTDISRYANLAAAHRFLQPCDVGDAGRNAQIVRDCVAFCLAHPEWRLSLQVHKILNIR